MIDSELLRAHELFTDLDDATLEAVLAAATARMLARNDVIFAEGTVADAMYIVVEGRVAISNKSFDGRESVVALMERGDLFGEMSLFVGSGRSAEARALEPTEMIVIPYAPVRQLWNDRPELLWRVITMLSERLRATDAALADSFFLDVTGRTAKHLLELAGDGDVFSIPVTQEELASMIGASRERVNKAISSFLRLGWIEARGNGYQILRRRDLEIRSR